MRCDAARLSWGCLIAGERLCRATGEPQLRSPLTRGVHTSYSYAPASLRSEGGNIPMDWVAEILWTRWQHSHGLHGNIPVDWVAEIRGIRTQPQRIAVQASH